MDRSRHCAACGIELEFLKREHIQLGKTGFLLGDWPNLLAGALDAEIWVCPAAGTDPDIRAGRGDLGLSRLREAGLLPGPAGGGDGHVRHRQSEVLRLRCGI